MKKLTVFILVLVMALSAFAGCTVYATNAKSDVTEEIELAEFTPVATGEQTQVHVATVDELLEAIAPNTEIILDSELYLLRDATNYAVKGGLYYRWQEVYDGVQLTIQNVSNLTIRAEGDDITTHTISATPRYAHVLNFENCEAITLEGFTAGHTIEPGACCGGVIGFYNCENTLINRCGLYGCGVVGVWAENTKGIQVANSDIYECSWGGVYMVTCMDVTFNGNTIRDLGEEVSGEWWDGTPFMLHDTRNITIDGETKPDNYIGK